VNIGTLARLFGLRSSTVRYYERLGILNPVGRIAGQRQYDRSAEDRLAFILSSRESGLTLREIKALIQAGSLGASPQRLWLEAVPKRMTAISRQIEQLEAARVALQAKLRCRCRSLRACERKLASEYRNSRGSK
jgi:DNA-binding transcriptional MerR regulator